jgi:UDP-glucose 4-epimerase
MTLDEAINLVLFAIAKGKNGQIIIPKTSATSIDVLTKALLKIFNYSSSKVKIIGTRHGEKLHETLISSEERFFSRSFNKYFVINSDNRELNYDAFFSKGKKKLLDQSDYTSASTNQLKTDQVIKIIKPLIGNSEEY